MLADNRLSALAHGDSNRALQEQPPAQPPPQQLVPPDALFNEQRDLRNYLALVMRRRWMIASVVTIVTTLVAIYMYRQPSVYEAETVIRLEQKQESFLRAKDIVINTANDPAYWRTQLKLLENPMLARRVILALDLHHNPNFFGPQARSNSSPLFSSLEGMLARDKNGAKPENSIAVGADPEALTAEERALLVPYVAAFKAGLAIEPVAETNLIKIRFTHTDPDIAMRVTNTLAELFMQDDAARENEGVNNALTQLSTQMTDLQTAIKQEEDERIGYIQNHGLPLGQTKGANLTSVRLDTLSGQLLAAENDRKVLQAAYEAAQASSSREAVPEVQTDKAVQEMKAKLRTLEQRRASLLVKYTAEWPEVKEIDEEVGQIRRELDKQSGDVLASMKSRYDAALKRELELRRSYFGELGAANQQSQSEIELDSLNQKIETNKQLYSTLFQRQKELQIDASDRRNNVVISTRSERPSAPIGPQRERNVVIAFFLSLFAATALAFLLQQLDDSIKSVDELVAYTSLPNLALIPAMQRQSLAGRIPLASLGRSKEPPSVELLENARSPVAEAFRHLRTSLLFSSGTPAPASILVTSGQALEGKTTVAFNTAVALAQTGASVLLVDCDLRRPSVQKHIGSGIEPGLTNYLAGEMKLEEALKPYEPLPNLKVMTSGYLPSNPAELLGSEEMLSFLARARASFTHVIIDSPPSISFADGAIISTLVDGVLLVIHGGKSSRAVVRHLISRLTGVGARLYGTVLNNVRPQPYDYYYNSYYYSYQGEGTQPRTLSKRPESAESREPQLDVTTEELEQEFEKFESFTKFL